MRPLDRFYDEDSNFFFVRMVLAIIFFVGAVLSLIAMIVMMVIDPEVFIYMLALTFDMLFLAMFFGGSVVGDRSALVFAKKEELRDPPGVDYKDNRKVFLIGMTIYFLLAVGFTVFCIYNIFVKNILFE